MEKRRPSFVCDASVLFSLIDGDLLELVARIFDLLVPDVILQEEVKEPPGESLVRKGWIQEIQLPGTMILKVAELREKYPAPSTNDLFALTIAHWKRMVLLTGDKHLRKAAEALNVEVHGVLWILDELVSRGHLKPAKAARSLRKIMASGTYLPEKECKLRLEQWEKR